MPAAFAQTNIVCLPSTYGEGVPKVLLEAAACARSIVATDAPGCREIVRHGENGLLVPLRDADALADAIETLLAKPDLRARMGRRGRSLVEAEFSDALVAEQTLAVYQELSAERDGRSARFG
jgi:glycosyltransferase involved in cell wall biosynthesis